MTHPLWPLFDLRLRTPRLELRLPTDDELVELAAVARAGIHAPEEMPFAMAWTDLPSPEFERSFVRYHWRSRGEWTAARWSLDLAVFEGGRPIGSQGLMADGFATLRTVHTGSWLGEPYQGHGFGKEMRAAVLHLAFGGLDADVAESSALVGNEASARVSRALGYEDDGWTRVAPRGTAVDVRRFRLTRERWLRTRTVETSIEGLEGCLELFGAARPGAGTAE